MHFMHTDGKPRVIIIFYCARPVVRFIVSGWLQMDYDEKLIEEVRKYDHLWNYKRSDFKDSQKRKNSWQEISKQLGGEGMCKIYNYI